MLGVKYKYAYDQNGELVDASSIIRLIEQNPSVRKMEYRCIECGEIIRPRGGARLPHFYHENHNCNPETYLHKLAKLRIKQAFDAQKEFFISLPKISTCTDVDTCKFAIGLCKESLSSESFDLKKWFDTCELEKEVGGFIADIDLYKSDNPNRSHIMIEVQVSHPCTKEKWDSPYRIVETKVIRKEEDIERIIQQGFDSSNCRINERFKVSRKNERMESDHIQRFYYFKSGKAYVKSPFPTGDYENDFKSYVNCRSRNKKKKNNSMFELNVDADYLGEPNVLQVGLLYLYMKHRIKNCLICKYYYYEGVLSRCNLYKKYGTPHNPEQPYAKICNYFRAMDYNPQDVESKVEEV